MAAPKLPKPPRLVFCAECGNPFYLVKVNQIFCAEPCRKALWNRRITAGFKLYEYVMQWRIDRPQNALAELTAVADMLASDEREIRKRRQATIARYRSQYPDIEAMHPAIGNPTSAQSVKLSSPEQHALRAAGVYCLAVADGKVPNDPDARPDGWSKRRLAALSAAIESLRLNGVEAEEPANA